MTRRIFLLAISILAVGLGPAVYAIGDGPILTPPTAAAPRINGPTVFGVRPGAPFLYNIPATGERPMTFAIDGLPAGLVLDTATGRITGTLATPGEILVTLRARNASGAAQKKFRIVVGERIALTPPMGWSSWNCFAHEVTQQNVLEMAKAVAATGLREHGWTYVNIDDCWQGPRRDPSGAIQAGALFPDMKKLGDEIHALGLKFGVYSTPWVASYSGYPGGTADDPDGRWNFDLTGTEGRHLGRHSFIAVDARQFAAWGVDYVKWDWRPNDIEHVREIYEAQRASGRDIVLSLSNGAQFSLAEQYAKYANALRISSDIFDMWSVPDLPSHATISEIAFAQERWAPFTRPGFYPDADMFVLGWVSFRRDVRLTRLTPDEQYTHMSMWCLLASPLMLGCDLTRLDPFTLSLLTNDEVLAVNQDALCQAATRRATMGALDIFVKDLEEGGKAVGFFNRSDLPQTSNFNKLGQVGLRGKQRVRDLWRQIDLPAVSGGIEVTVPAHGVLLYKFVPVEAGMEAP